MTDVMACIDRTVSGDHGPGCQCIRVLKHSTTVQISRDTALDYGLVQPTEAERVEREAWHAEYEQRKQAAYEAIPVFVAALAAVKDPVARAVLDLHRSGLGDCRGCEFRGYDAEPPPWPCSTIVNVAAALGITVPPDLDMVHLR